jgi:hypothetical protein
MSWTMSDGMKAIIEDVCDRDWLNPWYSIDRMVTEAGDWVNNTTSLKSPYRSITIRRLSTRLRSYSSC